MILTKGDLELAAKYMDPRIHRYAGQHDQMDYVDKVARKPPNISQTSVGLL